MDGEWDDNEGMERGWMDMMIAWRDKWIDPQVDRH